MKSIKEISKELRVGREKVYEMIRAGELAAIDLSLAGSSRAQFRVREEDFEAFLKRRRVGARGEQ